MHPKGKPDHAGVVLESLRRIVQELRVSSHVAERTVGVSGAQLFVLRELAAEPGCSIRRLSERTLTDPSSVSGVVAKLLAQGLITRGRDPDDARKSVLSVSRRGLSLLKRAPDPYQARLILALRALPSARLRQLGLSLSSVVASLQPNAGAPPLFFEDDPARAHVRAAPSLERTSTATPTPRERGGVRNKE